MTVKINNAYEDESVAITLAAYGRLIPESIEKGTESCRFSIFVQCGKTHDNIMMPAGLRIAQMRAEKMGTQSLRGDFGGRPDSECHLFKELSYIPAGDESKARLWAAGANYLSSCNEKDVYYEGLKSGYAHQSSALSDLYFCDTLCYVKQVVGVSYSMFAGVRWPFNILKDKITKDLTSRLNTLFNGKYVFSVDVYQTVEEQKKGYETHVAINIESPNQNLRWNVDINCSREGYVAE
jgi:hypothetical protein